MHSRILKKTKASLSEIGLGCWQFGGDFGPIDDARVAGILSTAIEEGIRFLDTADVYGAGRSEQLIGEFLKGCPAKLFVATKVGRGGGLYPAGYTREATRASIDGSRKRLGVDAIDLIQLHCVPSAVLKNGEIFDWLREFQREGLIRSFGASVETVEEGLLCLEQEGLVSLQVIFNVFRQKPLDELFPRAQSAGVGIIVRLPLASGLLAGKFTRDTRFDECDHRNFNRDGAAFNVGETFAGLPFEKGVELADALKPYVPENMFMAQWAQRWILDHPAVTSVITGASSPAQVKSNAAVSELPALSRQAHVRLADFYQNSVKRYIRGPY
jgi:aryl-alcohol dehydrogenase-like predicted oxidoreductase